MFKVQRKSLKAEKMIHLEINSCMTDCPISAFPHLFFSMEEEPFKTVHSVCVAVAAPLSASHGFSYKL